jgi:uncharacterized protein
MSKPSEDNRRKRETKCTICGKKVAADSASYPFCSERCRLVDLGQWFGERYTISRPIDQRDIDAGE